MQRARVYLSAVLTIATIGCRHDVSTTAATPARRRETRIVQIAGTLRPRDGVTIPATSTLRVVVRYSEGDILAEQTVANTGTWPLAFAFPVEWPNGKGMPMSGFDVSARAYVDGQPVMITAAKYYAYPKWRRPENDNSLDLVFVPIRE